MIRMFELDGSIANSLLSKMAVRAVMLRSLLLLFLIFVVKKHCFVTEIQLNFDLEFTCDEEIFSVETYVYT